MVHLALNQHVIDTLDDKTWHLRWLCGRTCSQYSTEVTVRTSDVVWPSNASLLSGQHILLLVSRTGWLFYSSRAYSHGQLR
jgi:hypothetical protein